MMNKRRSSGGGQSSLGYLFGSDDLLGQQQKDQSKVPVSPVCMPPYGTDKEEKLPEKLPTPHKKDDTGSSSNYIYHGDGDKSSGFLVTVLFWKFLYFLAVCYLQAVDRPSTRVKSVPGGDSSLGYLFGDK